MKMESMAHTKDCYYRLVWNFFHFFFVLFSEIVLQTLTTLNVGLLLVLLENEGVITSLFGNHPNRLEHNI